MHNVVFVFVIVGFQVLGVIYLTVVKNQNATIMVLVHINCSNVHVEKVIVVTRVTMHIVEMMQDAVVMVNAISN
jgi:hypothetical protein